MAIGKRDDYREHACTCVVVYLATKKECFYITWFEETIINKEIVTKNMFYFLQSIYYYKKKCFSDDSVRSEGIGWTLNKVIQVLKIAVQKSTEIK